MSREFCIFSYVATSKKLGVYASSHKVCDENKSRKKKKNDCRQGPYKTVSEHCGKPNFGLS